MTHRPLKKAPLVNYDLPYGSLNMDSHSTLRNEALQTSIGQNEDSKLYFKLTKIKAGASKFRLFWFISSQLCQDFTCFSLSGDYVLAKSKTQVSQKALKEANQFVNSMNSIAKMINNVWIKKLKAINPVINRNKREKSHTEYLQNVLPAKQIKYWFVFN